MAGATRTEDTIIDDQPQVEKDGMTNTSGELSFFVLSPLVLFKRALGQCSGSRDPV